MMSPAVSVNDEPATIAAQPMVPRRALLSVSDKRGIEDFAQRLQAHGVELFSTGGTGRALLDAGCAVRDVADYTGFPEMMDGRVKTLHPKIFAGILARRARPDDMDGLAAHEISTFDLIVVNLYPFERTIATGGVTDAEAIEQIDIGGPSLVRAAAKNFNDVAIVTDPRQYDCIIDQLDSNGALDLPLRRQLAATAFARTAEYDRAIADYFARSESFPESVGRVWRHQATLRYGENPHQQAALYADLTRLGPSLVDAKQLNGKELSYNNYLDLDAAWRIVRDQPGPSVSVIKHNNPCGASTAADLATAIQNALHCDPTSAFGSVLGVNRPLDAAVADVLSKPGLFIEAIIAPEFDLVALEILTTKPKWKNNVRLLACGGSAATCGGLDVRPVSGGALIQDRDEAAANEHEWKVVTERQPTESQLADLRFAWALVRHVRSNAIVIAERQTAWGVGAGQMSRVDAVEIAIKKAGDHAREASLASDAFFPFADSIRLAADAGVTAVIQPGGSKQDEAVIAEANQHGMAMIFTGRRHFKH